MKCNEFLSLLPMYPDAMANAQVAAQFREHAAECLSCAARLSEQELLLNTLGSLNDGVTVPTAFSEGWRSAVRMESAVPSRRGRSFRWHGLIAAAAVLVVVCGTALTRGSLLTSLENNADQQKAYMAEEYEAEADMGSPQTMMFAEGGSGTLPSPKAMSANASDMQSVAGDVEQQPVVLHSASVTINSEQYDADVQQIDELLHAIGGWMEYRSVSGEAIAQNPDSGRYAYLTLRVPTEALESFIDSVTAIGRVTGSELASEDISDQYYDTRGRLAMYEAQRDRLTALLGQAASMTDIIEIEARLNELQYTIETLVGRLNNWNARADNAVVRISVVEVAPGENATEVSLLQRIRDAMAWTLRASQDFLADMVVFVVILSPYVVCAAVVAAITLFIVKKKSRRRKET